VKLQLATLGQAQLDAAEMERRMEEEARRREARHASLQEAQRIRSSIALAKERMARSEQAVKLEAKKDLRSSILAAEREKVKS
jgi:hypothetical protein